MPAGPNSNTKLLEAGKHSGKEESKKGRHGKAGRPKGRLNDVTIKRTDIALRILAGPITPLEIMWDMARGKRRFNAQILEACKAAAPYVHPKLVAVKLDASVSVPHELALEQLDKFEELGDQVPFMAADGPIAVVPAPEVMEDEDEL